MTPPGPNDPNDPALRDGLHPRRLTWAVLLSKWTELAKASLALGDDPGSQAIKKLVPDIIALQAVWYALDDMHELPAGEQQLGCLRAQWLIDRHEANIRTSWPDDEALPATLEDLIADAHGSYERACKRLSKGEDDPKD